MFIVPASENRSSKYVLEFVGKTGLETSPPNVSVLISAVNWRAFPVNGPAKPVLETVGSLMPPRFSGDLVWTLAFVLVGTQNEVDQRI